MRRMGIGLGIGINRSNYAQGIFGAYQSRVVADGGVTEAGACVDAVSGLLLTASLLLIPSGYKSGKAYAQIPTSGNGDLTWTRASTALRTNSTGLLESMGSGVPRLSYMYGSCPALLLEPQRTNLVLQSESFDNASWSKSLVTISSNVSATLDPMGGNNAEKFIANATNSVHNISQTGFASAAYTFTVYAKAAEETIFSMWLRGSSFRAEFNLSNGTVSNSTVTSATITSAGNGWYRCSVYDSTPGTTAAIYGRIGGSYAGNSVDGFYIFGAQLEAGAYPTTYIPTTTASATRVADSFSRNNIFTNGLITSSGGTWFVELRGNLVYTRDTASYGLAISDQTTPSIGGGASGNTLAIIRTSTSSVRLQIVKQESLTFTSLFTTTTDTVKIAIKWNGTSADVFVNGTKQVSATAFTATTLQNLVCLATDVPRFIQAMALYPSPLSDTDCTTLTTL